MLYDLCVIQEKGAPQRRKDIAVATERSSTAANDDEESILIHFFLYILQSPSFFIAAQCNSRSQYNHWSTGYQIISWGVKNSMMP
jgi:hypothetical protein